MPENGLNDLLRHHVAQGHIHRVYGQWEAGIYSPWEPVTSLDWLGELDRMLADGEIVQKPNSDDVILGA